MFKGGQHAPVHLSCLHAVLQTEALDEEKTLTSVTSLFFWYPLTLKPLDPHPPPPPWQTEASDEEKTLTSVASEGDASALETTAADMAAAAAALVSVERDLIAMQANGADGAGLAAKQVRSGFVCFCSLVGGSNWASKICF